MIGRRVKYKVWKNLLLHCILSLSVYCSNLQCVSSLDVKTCDNAGTFKQMFGISLPVCAEECFRRQRCQIFMFRFGMNYCALKDGIDIQSLEEEGPVCRYYTLSDWSEIDLGPCNEHNCSGTERCISKTDDGFECVKSECPKPVEITDAILLSNTHSIGSRNRYKCNTEFGVQGTPTILCGDDAEWSVTDFLCISAQSCPAPEQQYINADLTHVEGSLYTPGTILTFTCREGYRQMGDEWNSTCQDSLLWEPQNIRCCPDTSTHENDEACFAIIEGGIANTLDGVEDHCTSIGGEHVWVSWHMREWLDKTTTEFALQTLKVSWVDDNWNYVKCAALNGVEGDDSKSLREKIDDVIDNNWKYDGCWWGRTWLPGQPSFNGNDCIVRSLHDQQYRLSDFPCTSSELQTVGFACQFNTPDI